MQPPTIRLRLGTALSCLVFALVSGCSENGIPTEPEKTPSAAPQVPPEAPSPGSPSDPRSASIVISGWMTPQHQRLEVHRGMAPVTNAVVTVNGVPLGHRDGGSYQGSLPEPVTSGGKLNLKVVIDGIVFEPPGEVAPIPTITAPEAGTVIRVTDPITLLWSSPANPDRFEICTNCWENSLDGAVYPASGATREHLVAAGALVDYGGGSPLAVVAIRNNFLNPAKPAEVASTIRFIAASQVLITVEY